MKLSRNIAICSIFLGLFGIVMIYSASSYSAKLDFNDEFLCEKQAQLCRWLSRHVHGLEIKSEIPQQIQMGNLILSLYSSGLCLFRVGR